MSGSSSDTPSVTLADLVSKMDQLYKTIWGENSLDADELTDLDEEDDPTVPNDVQEYVP